MQKAWRYVVARLAEPGTLRSLIWCLVSLMGIDQGETWITHAAGIAGLVLGAVSAMLPETPQPAPRAINGTACHGYHL